MGFNCVDYFFMNKVLELTQIKFNWTINKTLYYEFV